MTNANVTHILARLERGDDRATAELLPLVYDELRRLASAKLVREAPGQTLQATALVHEAYLRLVGSGADAASWQNRGHFFAAAAEAMRRILVESARRKQSVKHGGGRDRAVLDAEALQTSAGSDPAELLAAHELLARLAEKHPRKAQVVKLRYFLGCTQPEAAEVLGITEDAVQDDWSYARAWLKREWQKGDPEA